MTNRTFWNSDFFPIPPGSEVNVASDVGNWVVNRYLPIIAQNVLLVHVRARDISTVMGAWFTIPYTGYFGGWPSDAMAANVTLQLRLRNAPPVQRQQPYLCLPAPPRDAVVENEFTSAYMAAVVDAWSYYFDCVFVSGLDWVWLSFRHDNAWRSVPETYYVGALQPNPVVAPRRRRLKNVNLYP